MSDSRPPHWTQRGGLRNVRRVGLREHTLADLYHMLVQQRWGGLFAISLLAYVLVNAAFGGLYMLAGGVSGMREGSYVDALAFSVQTLTTIGYGAMTPTEPLAHLLVAFEVFLGLLGFALITGLIFAKFSRPTARVLFSRKAVVTVNDGQPCLMFRMANERISSRIVEAELNVTLLRDTKTVEGVFMRRFFDLKLERSRSPIFALSWTVIHVIDAQSPLREASREWLETLDVDLLVSYVGIDETMSQTLHGRYAYKSEDIEFDRRLADVLEQDEHGRLFNYRRFHDTVPSDGDVCALLRSR